MIITRSNNKTTDYVIQYTEAFLDLFRLKPPLVVLKGSKKCPPIKLRGGGGGGGGHL